MKEVCQLGNGLAGYLGSKFAGWHHARWLLSTRQLCHCPHRMRANDEHSLWALILETIQRKEKKAAYDSLQFRGKAGER